MSGESKVVEPPPPSPTEVKIAELKKKLMDSFDGTDRGLKVESESRAQIVELITQLEALNPTLAPTEALPLLNGKWISAYTSYAGLFPLLPTGKLPLVKVEEISQAIDPESFKVQNSVKFSSPLATSSISTNAKFEVRSPKPVQNSMCSSSLMKASQLTDSVVIPEEIMFFGQKIDLAPFKGLISSVQDTISSVVKISSKPPLKIPISRANAESWLITIYLVNVRISRGDAGSVFVFLKDGRPPLSF